MPKISQWQTAIVCSVCLSFYGCNQATPPKSDTAEERASQTSVTVKPETESEPADDAEPAPAEASKSLTIGDTAPVLQVAEWVKGDAIEGYGNDRIHIVEFWATWCGPCRTGMPHISHLQESYGKEVTFVGVTREDRATVDGFLQKTADPAIAEQEGQTWNDLMRYTVALDQDGSTSASFMEAAGERGIPTAFVVGYDGKIEWIGHPASIDEPLEKIVGRNWDRQAALAERKKAQEMEKIQQKLFVTLRKAMGEENWDEALTALDEAEKFMPDSPQLKFQRFDVLLQAKKFEKGIEVMDQLVEQFGENPRALNSLAWSLANSGTDSKDVLQKALEVAKKSSKLAEDADGNIMDTVARVYSKLGDLDQAIQWQQRAVDATPGNKQLEEALAEYKAAANPEESAADDKVETAEEQPAEAE